MQNVCLGVHFPCFGDTLLYLAMCQPPNITSKLKVKHNSFENTLNILWRQINNIMQ